MSTDTLEDLLRTRLHAAVDRQQVTLGATAADLVGRAHHRSQVTTWTRSVAVAAVVAIVAGGVWWGTNRYGNLIPSHRTPAQTVTLLSQSGLGGDPGSAVQVVVDDQLVFRTADGTELGRLPRTSTGAWAVSRVDGRVRFGVVPANTSLPLSWGQAWIAVPSAAPLPDGRFAYVLRFRTAEQAAQASTTAITVTSDGHVADPQGRAHPSRSLQVPNPSYPGDLVQRLIFVDPASSAFGMVQDVVGGPLGAPQPAYDAPVTSAAIGATGAGLSSTSASNPDGTFPVGEVYGVVPATATDIRLVGPKGVVAVGIRTADIPGSRLLAFWASQALDSGPLPLAAVRTVSWTDPASGRRVQYTAAKPAR